MSVNHYSLYVKVLIRTSSSTILRGLGYSTALSNILVAPPYVFAVLFALATSWVSRTTKASESTEI